MNKNFSKINALLFYFYLGLLLWLPLPLGSNRSWAIAIMVLWILLLSWFWIILFLTHKAQLNTVFYKALPVLSLFLLFSLWTLIQSLPIPYLASWLAPNIAQTYLDMQQVTTQPFIHPPLSLNSYLSTGKSILSLAYSLLFCLTLLLVNTQQRLKLVAITILISGVFQALYGSIISLSGATESLIFNLKIDPNKATGSFVNRNHLAGHLEMCLAIGIGFMLSTLHTSRATTWRESLRRIVFFILSRKFHIRIALIIMVTALVLTRSRMGNTAFFVSLSCMGIVYLTLHKKPSHNIVILFISLILIDIFVIGVWFGLDKLIERIEQTKIVFTDKPRRNTLPQETSTSPTHSPHKFIQIQDEPRDEVIQDTFKMIQDNWLTGTGGGTYAIGFLRYQGQDIKGFYDHAHNDYLEFFAEYGFIGCSLLGLIMLIIIYHALITIKTRHSPLLKGMAFASAMAIMEIAIHSSTDFNLQIPANTALFIVILAIALIARYTDECYNRSLT